MGGFESKLVDILHKNPKFAHHIPIAIRLIFRKSEREFQQRLEYGTGY